MAQIIESAIVVAYGCAAVHCALVSSLRSTECSTLELYPPSEVAPHPATVTVVSAPL